MSHVSHILNTYSRNTLGDFALNLDSVPNNTMWI